MPDFLEKLVMDAKRRVSAGYYEVQESVEHEPKSLKEAIKTAEGNAIICGDQTNFPLTWATATNNRRCGNSRQAYERRRSGAICAHRARQFRGEHQ